MKNNFWLENIDINQLSSNQRNLLAYREVIELKKNYDDKFNLIDDIKLDNLEALELLRILKLSKNKTQLLKLYLLCNYENLFRILYKDSLEKYYNILKNYKILAQELNISDALELSYLFAILLYNGYFSSNKKQTYNSKDKLMLPSMYSFDVMCGKGVCLSYSELLTNYLNYCGKKSSLMVCKVKLESSMLDYELDKQLLMKLKEQLKFLLRKRKENHAISLIEDNGNLFAFDVTNMYVLNIINSKIAKVINEDEIFKINPSLTLSEYPNCDPYHLLEKLLFEQIPSAFNKDDIEMAFSKILELSRENVSLFDSVYENVHSDLEFIKKQVEKIGDERKILSKLKK